MNSREIKYSKTIEVERLTSFLNDIEGDFIPPMSKRISIPDYAQRLHDKAELLIALSGDEVVGLVGFYCNDQTRKNGYLSILGVKKEFRRSGIGTKLLQTAIDTIKETGIEKILLETVVAELKAPFYAKHGFEITERIAKTDEHEEKVKMSMWLGTIDKGFNLNPTPIEFYPKLSTALGVNLFVKRDDIASLNGDGGKVRKLYHILKNAEKEGYNAFVTTGGGQSNLIRVSALNAAKFGWKVILIVHDTKPERMEGNLKVSELLNGELRFVDKKDIREAMDHAMEDLKAQGYKPLYIKGGGDRVEGSFAFYDAIGELKKQLQNIRPDFLVFASGTGTTQAGLEVGIRHLYPGCKVLGVSVARDEKKGKSSIIESMKELNTFLDHPIDMPEDVFFDDRWIGDGHEAAYPELIDTIYWTARTEGLILDPTYTGKAFHALRNYIEDGSIPKGSNIIFWHSGGLLNLLASHEI
jgi:1-aminocyclopropane-1-carboxylate deaminase/D-cysteine desulfhydrase-like pyridoxal-dependent ACC family enzyme/GNAT superfamily N-acetyltransferase